VNRYTHKATDTQLLNSTVF